MALEDITKANTPAAFHESQDLITASITGCQLGPSERFSNVDRSQADHRQQVNTAYSDLAPRFFAIRGPSLVDTSDIHSVACCVCRVITASAGLPPHVPGTDRVCRVGTGKGRGCPEARIRRRAARSGGRTKRPMPEGNCR